MSRILFLTSSDIINVSSGYSRRCSAFLAWLRNKNYEVDLSQKNEVKVNKIIFILFSCLLYPILPIHVILHNIKKDKIRYEKYDIIWLNHSYFLFWIPKKYRSKCVVDVHADPVETYLGYSRKNFIYYLIFRFEIVKMRIFERLLLGSVRTVITCNAFETEWYSIFSKVIYIPNGTNYKVDQNKNDIDDNGDIILGFLSGRSTKNLPALNEFISIVEKCSNSRGKVAGYITDYNNCNSEEIEYLGRLSEAEISDFYVGVHFMVLPYTWGGGSKLKVIEAWAHGVPVIGYDKTFDGLNFDGLDYCTGKSQSELMDILAHFSQNNEIYAELSKKCRLAAGKYCWKKLLSDCDLESVISKDR